MADSYFSEREHGGRPRNLETFDVRAWGGIASTIQAFIDNGGFGADFPADCPDSRGTTGTSIAGFAQAIEAEHPDVSWPLRADQPPSPLAILDVVEFCHRHAATADQLDYHQFFGHHHLRFEREAGQRDFRDRVNRIFRRNGIAFELKETGEVVRLAPPVLREALQQAIFATGDPELDMMLETARVKFLDPSPPVRREALEKLWDAFERVKTLELAADKRAAIAALLAKASPEERFRGVLDEEGKALTAVGNTFFIRHSETTQTPLEHECHVDYLFHRLFALVRLYLERRNA